MKLAVRRSRPVDADALEAFGSESAQGLALAPPPQLKPFPLRRILLSIAVVALVTGGSVYGWRRVAAARVAPATVVIDATPAGAGVFIDGHSRGRAPLTLQLAPGQHAAEIVLGTQRIPLKIEATAGATIAHHVQFSAPAAAPAAPSGATLRVSTEPAKLDVFVDGVNRGASPVRIAGVAPGSHRVRVVSPAGATERSVSLNPGEELSLVLSAGLDAKQAGGGGFVTVSSPVPLRLMEGSQLVGTSDVSKIMLPAGTHELDLVNEDLGFREHHSVAIAAGKALALAVNVPRAPVNLNAVPWADVWIDNDHVGETPIGNHSVPIGTHQVIFRNPELGERRQQIVVGLKSANRVSVDLTKK